MKIEPAVTWIGVVVMIAVGLFVSGCAVFLLFRHQMSASAVSFILFGLTTVILGGGQIAYLRKAKTDKPLDKASASRHLAGPGRIWRPR